MTSLHAWSLPTTLTPPLSGREAVADAAYRALLGFDTNRLDLFQSAFTQDATLTMHDGEPTSGLGNIVSWLFSKMSKLDTTHHLTNIRINIDEASNRATLSANVLAQHYCGGKGADPKAAGLLVGALYMLDLVKEDGDVEIWKIARWRVQSMWREGDVTMI